MKKKVKFLKSYKEYSIYTDGSRFYCVNHPLKIWGNSSQYGFKIKNNKNHFEIKEITNEIFLNLSFENFLKYKKEL